MDWRALFTSVTAELDRPLLGTLTSMITHGISFTGGILALLGALAFAFVGIAIATGFSPAPAKGVMWTGFRLAFACAIASTAIYSYYVRDFIMTAMPEVASQLTGAAPSTTQHSYDVLLNLSIDAFVTLWGKASWTLRPLLLLFIPPAAAAIAFGYGVWLQGHVMGAVYVAIGSVFAPLFMFAPTRPVFTAWCGCLLSCTVLQALSVVLAAMTVGVEALIMGQIVNDTGSDVQMRTGMLLAAALMFVLFAWFARKLPNAAAAMCGGIHYSPEALTAATFGAVTAGAKEAARIGVDKAQEWTARARNNVRASANRPASITPAGASVSRSVGSP